MWINGFDGKRWNSHMILFVDNNDVAHFAPDDEGIKLDSSQIHTLGLVRKTSHQIDDDSLPPEVFFTRLSQTGIFTMPRMDNGYNKSTLMGIGYANQVRRSRKAFISAYDWGRDYDVPFGYQDDIELSWDDLATYLIEKVTPWVLKMERAGISFRISKGKLGKYSLADFFFRQKSGKKPISVFLNVCEFAAKSALPKETKESILSSSCMDYVRKWVERSGKIDDVSMDRATRTAEKTFRWWVANNDRLMEKATNSSWRNMWKVRCNTAERFFATLYNSGASLRFVPFGYFPFPDESNLWKIIKKSMAEEFDIDIE